MDIIIRVSTGKWGLRQEVLDSNRKCQSQTVSVGAKQEVESQTGHLLPPVGRM